MNSIQHSIFISVVDKFITEDSFTFMSPKTHSIKLWLKVLDSICLHYRLFLNLQNTLESSGKLTHIEQIMKFSRSRQHELLNKLPQLNGCWSQVLNNFFDLIRQTWVLSIDSELELNDRSIDPFNWQWQNHIENKELSFESVWNVIPATSWMVHGTDEWQVFDVLEVASLCLI